MDPVSFTSRDIRAVREDIINYIKSKNIGWTDFSQSDIGMVLIDVMSGVADMLNYYIDTQSREAFLMLATEAKNIRGILDAYSYPYRMVGSAQARVKFRVARDEIMSSDKGVNIPLWTRVSTSQSDANSQINYLTTEASRILPGESSVDVTVMEGNMEDITVTSSMLSHSYKFDLGILNIPKNGIRILQADGEWERVDDAFVELNGGKKFSVHYSPKGTAYILFSYNWKEFLPKYEDEEITIRYVVSHGTAGNVGVGELIEFQGPIFDDDGYNCETYLSVVNESVSFGAEDEEDWIQAKANAKNYIRSMGRAVTLEDYEGLVLSNPNVCQAYLADKRTNKTLVNAYYQVKAWVVPNEGELEGEHLQNILDPIKAQIDASCDVIVDFKVEQAEFVTRDIDIACVLFTSNRAEMEEVRQIVDKAVREWGSYKNLRMGTNVYRSNLINFIEGLDPRIDKVVIVGFDSNIYCSPNQVPYVRIKYCETATQEEYEEIMESITDNDPKVVSEKIVTVDRSLLSSENKLSADPSLNEMRTALKTLWANAKGTIVASCLAISALLPCFGAENAQGIVDLPPGTATQNDIKSATPIVTNAWQAVESQVHQAITNEVQEVIDATGGLVRKDIDDEGNRTALTIGTRNSSVGVYSAAFGERNEASGNQAYAFGWRNSAVGFASFALGAKSYILDDYSYGWNGDSNNIYYGARLPGTYSINPVGGIEGFWIGAHPLSWYLSEFGTSVTKTGPPLSSSQIAAGITYESNGYKEDGAVEIGIDAKAQVSSNAVASLFTPNTHIRNVGIAVGTRAIAEGSSDTKNQSIAIGYSAHAVGSCATAIGPGARHYDNETDLTGNNAYAEGSTALAIGYSTKAIGTAATAIGAGVSGGNKTKAEGTAAIAIGQSAQANADGAVQIGTGINNEANTLKFQNVTIVRDGKIVGGSDTNTTARIQSLEDNQAKFYLSSKGGMFLEGEGKVDGSDETKEDVHFQFGSTTNGEMRMWFGAPGFNPDRIPDDQKLVFYRGSTIDSMTNEIWEAQWWLANTTVPLLLDSYDEYTASMIGTRDLEYNPQIGSRSFTVGSGNVASMPDSFAGGVAATSTGYHAFSWGDGVYAEADDSIVLGCCAAANSGHVGSFVWSSGNSYLGYARSAQSSTRNKRAYRGSRAAAQPEGFYYEDHGAGTFSIDPIGGPDGFWIGEMSFSQYLQEAQDTETPVRVNDLENRVDALDEKVSALTEYRDMYLAPYESTVNAGYLGAPAYGFVVDTEAMFQPHGFQSTIDQVLIQNPSDYTINNDPVYLVVWKYNGTGDMSQMSSYTVVAISTNTAVLQTASSLRTQYTTFEFYPFTITPGVYYFRYQTVNSTDVSVPLAGKRIGCVKQQNWYDPQSIKCKIVTGVSLGRLSFLEATPEGYCTGVRFRKLTSVVTQDEFSNVTSNIWRTIESGGMNLDPHECIYTNPVVLVKSHVVNDIMCGATSLQSMTVDFTGTMTADLFFDNTLTNRMNLPFRLSSTSGRLLCNQDLVVKKLPALVSFKCPKEGVAVVNVQQFDDGYEWNPQVTGTNLRRNSSGDIYSPRTFKISGSELQFTTSAKLRITKSGVDTDYDLYISRADYDCLYCDTLNAVPTSGTFTLSVVLNGDVGPTTTVVPIPEVTE